MSWKLELGVGSWELAGKTGGDGRPLQQRRVYRFLPPFFAAPFLAAFFAVFFAMRYPPLRCGIAMSLTAVQRRGLRRAGLRLSVLSRRC